MSCKQRRMVGRKVEVRREIGQIYAEKQGLEEALGKDKKEKRRRGMQ